TAMPTGGITPTENVVKVKTEQITMQRQVKIQATSVSNDGLESSQIELEASALDTAMSSMQGDAPACTVCSTITVRNGTCYKCMNCGTSLGCS
ncbi:MAG: hypothetical protein ACKVLC_02900, partial [Phycisphaerales bacterium]